MKKVFYLAVATLFALSFASCKSDKKQGNEQEEATTVESLVDDVTAMVTELSDEAKAKFEELGEGFFGTYTATLPGADNPGFETTLTINADLTYNWSQNVVGVEEVETETGKVTDINTDMIITLLSDNGDTKLFKLIDGKLLMLSQDGSEPGEATRDAYFFTRQ